MKQSEIKRKEFSEKVLKFRAEKNISQTEMANLCKLSKVTIANIENETAKITKLTAAKVERILSN